MPGLLVQHDKTGYPDIIGLSSLTKKIAGLGQKPEDTGRAIDPRELITPPAELPFDRQVDLLC